MTAILRGYALSGIGTVNAQPRRTTHKASNAAAAPDPVTKALIETGWFANSGEGYDHRAGFSPEVGAAGGRWRAAVMPVAIIGPFDEEAAVLDGGLSNAQIEA